MKRTKKSDELNKKVTKTVSRPLTQSSFNKCRSVVYISECDLLRAVGGALSTAPLRPTGHQ